MEEQERLTRAKSFPVEGWVWCDSHGCVHEDDVDPYGEGIENGCLSLGLVGFGVRKKDVHRQLLVKRLKGDWPDEVS